MNVTQEIWLTEQRDGKIAKIFAFLLSPVLGMLIALFRPNTKSSYIVLFLSFITMGLTMIVPDDRTDEMNFDSIAYRLQFEDMASLSSADFSTTLSDYSQMNEDGATDIFASVLYYVVSRFTGNYHICFLVIAIIFSIFMLKSLRYLVSNENYHISILCILLLFLFTIVQIQQINAFRFYTAYWVALFALLKIILDKNRRYLLLLAVTPAIHGAFFLVFVVYLLYLIIRNRPILSFWLVIIAFLLSSIALPLFTSILQFLPDSLGGHYSEYIDMWYVLQRNKSGTGNIWIVRVMELAVRLSIIVVAIFFARKYKSHIVESKANDIYYLLMAITAFVSFTFMIPDVGSRNVMFVYPLVAYIWLVCFSQERKLDWFIYLFAGMYLFLFLVLPWNIYQIPCFKYYRILWNADILYQSPIYLWVKYILFPPA